METTERINVRGAINALGVGGEPLELPKADYIPSSVRNTAASIKSDTGKKAHPRASKGVHKSGTIKRKFKI